MLEHENTIFDNLEIDLLPSASAGVDECGVVGGLYEVGDQYPKNQPVRGATA